MKTYFRTNRIIINNKIINKKYRVTINLNDELNHEILEFKNKFPNSILEASTPNVKSNDSNGDIYHVTISVNDNNNHFEDEIVCYFILSKANQNQYLLKLIQDKNEINDTSIYLKDVFIDPLYSGNLFYFICILKSLKISQQKKYSSIYLLTKLDLTSIWLNLERFGFKRIYQQINNANKTTNTLNRFKSNSSVLLYRFDLFNDSITSDWDSLINDALSYEHDKFWKQYSTIHNIKSKL